MTAVLVVRQIFIRLLLVIPFILAFYTIATPLNLLVLCIYVVKLRLPDPISVFELSIVSRFTAKQLSDQREGSDEFRSIAEAFGFAGERITSDDVRFGPAKVAVDTVFDIIEAIIFLVLLGSGILMLLFR
ncbi:hypothetical protein AB4Z13_16310 [Rhizobium sp. YAF28]|uniref:hypothetical protein n=1 Tax=Rhizobium sp. YAF28 TaxID=3233081 RepID=UPI003F9E3BDC